MRKKEANLALFLESHVQHMWFDTFGCPRLVADTFVRPVVVFVLTLRVFANGIEFEVDNNVVYNVVYKQDRLNFVS